MALKLDMSKTANLQECSKIADIISLYEGTFGQKINYDKSEVVFSKKVTSNSKSVILSALGVREVDKYERYLGLPTIIERSKKAICVSIEDRVWKKLQGWKERMLSKPGKEVIIKAVTQAIPTYILRQEESMTQVIYGEAYEMRKR
ncbi:uncharacterized protein LOC141651373 [Silene latifolia]|uniref:uncharacterized protein LOC141651373 n=1 Tax=Silene latifolia TaxID=37657 RepID=UPI003D76E33F